MDNIDKNLQNIILATMYAMEGAVIEMREGEDEYGEESPFSTRLTNAQTHVDAETLLLPREVREFIKHQIGIRLLNY